MLGLPIGLGWPMLGLPIGLGWPMLGLPIGLGWPILGLPIIGRPPCIFYPYPAAAYIGLFAALSAAYVLT